MFEICQFLITELARFAISIANTSISLPNGTSATPKPTAFLT